MVPVIGEMERPPLSSEPGDEAHEDSGPRDEEDHGEDLGERGGRMEIAVADGRERHDAEVDGIDDAPTFDRGVEHRPRHEHDDQGDEGVSEFGVPQSAPGGGQGPDDRDQHRKHRGASRAWRSGTSSHQLPSRYTEWRAKLSSRDGPSMAVQPQTPGPAGRWPK